MGDGVGDVGLLVSLSLVWGKSRNCRRVGMELAVKSCSYRMRRVEPDHVRGLVLGERKLWHVLLLQTAMT